MVKQRACSSWARARMVYARDRQLRSWRAGVLQSLAPTQIKHTCRYPSSDLEDIDYLLQVCLIRVGAKLCLSLVYAVFNFTLCRTVCSFVILTKNVSLFSRILSIIRRYFAEGVIVLILRTTVDSWLWYSSYYVRWSIHSSDRN